jgi:hypothetical protein
MIEDWKQYSGLLTGNRTTVVSVPSTLPSPYWYIANVYAIYIIIKSVALRPVVYYENQQRHSGPLKICSFLVLSILVRDHNLQMSIYGLQNIAFY